MDVIEKGSRRFADRPAIERAGYVPGWHGEPVEVGEQAVVYGQGQWREAIVTKVTPATVHVVFTTPTAITVAQKYVAGTIATDPLRVRADVRAMELRNWDYYERETGSNPRHASIRQPADLERMKGYVAEGREAYADRLADEAAERARERAKAAKEKGWTAYVHPVKGKGARAGTNGTSLYVKPR